MGLVVRARRIAPDGVTIGEFFDRFPKLQILHAIHNACEEKP